VIAWTRGRAAAFGLTLAVAVSGAGRGVAAGTAGAPCPVRLGAAGRLLAAETPGAAVSAACQPAVVPLAGYGAPLAEGERPAVLPGGDLLVIAAPRSAAPGAVATPDLEELGPTGRVRWRLPAETGTLVAGDGVAAILGQTLDIVNLADRRLVRVELTDSEYASHGVAVVGGSVLLVRWAGLESAIGVRALFFDRSGRLERRVKLRGAGQQGSTVMAQVGAAAFVETEGDLYVIHGPDEVQGPFAAPGEWRSMTVLSASSVLVRNPGQIARFDLGPHGLSQAWVTAVSGGPLVPLVLGQGTVLVPGTPAGDHGITVLDLRTGRVEGRIQLPDTVLVPLAAGPFGVVAEGEACGVTQGPCSAVPETVAAPWRLWLIGPSGAAVWSYATCADPSPTASLYRLVGQWLMVGPCGPSLAVVWGGQVPVSGAGSGAAYLAATAAPALPAVPAGAAVGYALFDAGRPITSAQPLVVTAQQVGHPIPLTVHAVNAAGTPIPTLSPVTLQLNADGGAFAFVPGQSLGAISFDDPSGRGLAIGYTPAHAGRCVPSAAASLSAGPGPVQPFQEPAAPSALIAGQRFTVRSRLVDGNGVPLPLAAGDAVRIELGSGSDATGATAVVVHPDAASVVSASFRAGPRTGEIAEQVVVDGSTQSPVWQIAPAQATPVADIRPPRVSLGPSGSLRIAPAPLGDRPVGYLVFAVRSGTAPSAGDDAPAAAIALVPAVANAVNLPVGSSVRSGMAYFVEAVDADGVASAPSAAVG
jgi:hypothetical protein